MVFVSDPAFCPLCGTILPLPSASDKVSCKVCKHSQDTASKWGHHVTFDLCTLPNNVIVIQDLKVWRNIHASISPPEKKSFKSLSKGVDHW